MKPVRIEKPPVRRGNAGARTSMKEQYRLAVGAADLLEIDFVKPTIQPAATKWRLNRKQLLFLDKRVGHGVSISQKRAA